MAPLALTANFRFSPTRILRDRWAHDLAHVFVSARMLATDAAAPLRKKFRRSLPPSI